MSRTTFTTWTGHSAADRELDRLLSLARELSRHPDARPHHTSMAQEPRVSARPTLDAQGVQLRWDGDITRTSQVTHS
jgi:hypothetical protein